MKNNNSICFGSKNEKKGLPILFLLCVALVGIMFLISACDYENSNANANGNALPNGGSPKDSADSGNVNNTNDAIEEVISPFLNSFTIKAACRKEYHALQLDYNFSRTVSNVTIQARLENDSEVSDLLVTTGVMSTSDVLYFCEICPIEAKMRVTKTGNYFLRLLINVEGEISYSKVLPFSTIKGTEFMANICSTKDETPCDDSEESRNALTRGVVTLEQRDYVENCVDSMHTDEYWCEDNKVRRDIVSCQTKCYVGRCI
jgi:hypothetical protein